MAMSTEDDAPALLDVIHGYVVDKREPLEVRCGYPAHTTREALVAHRRAKLTVFGRQLLVDRIETDGWSVAHAAAAAGVSRQTATKWLRRYWELGRPGLEDRSSRPHRSPRGLPRVTVEAILVHRRIGVLPPSAVWGRRWSYSSSQGPRARRRSSLEAYIRAYAHSSSIVRLKRSDLPFTWGR